jgi:hypothetical protein
LFHSAVHRRLVGRFEALFGTERGARLQEFARNISVGLAWSFDTGLVDSWSVYEADESYEPGDFYSDLWNGTWESGLRLLDPTVLEFRNAFNSTKDARKLSLNASFDDATFENFVSLWANVTNLRDATGNASQSALRTSWRRLAEAVTTLSLQVRPPAPRECANWNRCIGVSAVGSCVCYQSDEAISDPS